MGTFASRGTHRVGNAVIMAAQEAREAMLDAAAEELEVDAEDLETDGTGFIKLKGSEEKKIHIVDLALAAHFKLGRTIAGRGIFLKERSYPVPETGEMDPDSCQAHACTVAEVEVDDETGVVEVLAMHNVYEVGRAINPAMATQQIEGGAWMGISHALFEATEPYYPARDHGPRDFEEYLMPGPADNAAMESEIIERPAANGPFGAKGIGEMTANAPIPAIANAIFDACGVRLDADAVHAGAGPARAGRAARVIRSTSSGRRLAERALLRRRGAAHRGPPRADAAAAADRSRASRASARPSSPRCWPRVLGRELIRLQCYEGLDAAQALYEWDHPKQLLAIRACEAEGRPVGELYDERFLMERPLLRALRRAVRAADRRDRPRGLGVRGVPARVPERLPDHDPGARARSRAVDAADRRDDLQPHARAARRAQAALPLSLDRVPGRRARAARSSTRKVPGLAEDAAASLVEAVTRRARRCG